MLRLVFLTVCGDAVIPVSAAAVAGLCHEHGMPVNADKGRWSIQCIDNVETSGPAGFQLSTTESPLDSSEPAGPDIVDTLYAPAGPSESLQCSLPTWKSFRTRNVAADLGFLPVAG